MTQNIELQKYWILTYKDILVPTLTFINSKTSALFEEYNPRYTMYRKNIHVIAANVLKRLQESQVLDTLYQCLENNFDPEDMNNSQLICLYTFEDSIFTQIPYDSLKKLIETDRFS